MWKSIHLLSSISEGKADLLLINSVVIINGKIDFCEINHGVQYTLACSYQNDVITDRIILKSIKVNSNDNPILISSINR